jgi:hypothetical protein
MVIVWLRISMMEVVTGSDVLFSGFVLHHIKDYHLIVSSCIFLYKYEMFLWYSRTAHFL